MITSLGEQGAGYSTMCPCFVVTGHRTFLISYRSSIVITSLGEQGAAYCTVWPSFVLTGHRTFSHILRFWHCDDVTRGRGSSILYCVPIFSGHRPHNFFSYFMVLAL